MRLLRCGRGCRDGSAAPTTATPRAPRSSRRAAPGARWRPAGQAPAAESSRLASSFASSADRRSRRLHVPGRSRNTGSYRGADGLAGFLASASAITDGTLRTELHRVLADDEWAVALATYTASRPDRAPLANHLAHVMRLEDGRVAESWFHSRDQYEVDAFWGAPDDVQKTDEEA